MKECERREQATGDSQRTAPWQRPWSPKSIAAHLFIWL